jgi:hypothetical protein
LIFTAEGPRSIDDRDVLYVYRDAPDGTLYGRGHPLHGERRGRERARPRLRRLGVASEAR